MASRIQAYADAASAPSQKKLSFYSVRTPTQMVQNGNGTIGRGHEDFKIAAEEGCLRCHVVSSLTSDYLGANATTSKDRIWIESSAPFGSGSVATRIRLSSSAMQDSRSYNIPF